MKPAPMNRHNTENKRRERPSETIERATKNIKLEKCGAVAYGSPKAFPLLTQLDSRMGEVSRGVYDGAKNKTPERTLQELYELVLLIEKLLVVLVTDADIAVYEFPMVRFPVERLRDTIQSIAALHPGIENKITAEGLKDLITCKQMPLCRIFEKAEVNVDVGRLACQSWEALLNWVRVQKEAINDMRFGLEY